MDYFQREHAERFRRQADRVRGLAEMMRDPQNRTQLLDIARQYELLARSIEQLPPPRPY